LRRTTRFEKRPRNSWRVGCAFPAATRPVYIIDGVRVTRDDNIRQRLAKLGIDANRVDLGNMQWIVTNAGVFGTDPTYINVLYLKRPARPDSAPIGSRGGAAPR